MSLNNMPIRSKLILFISILILGAGLVSAFLLYSLKSVQSEAENIGSNWLPSIYYTSSINTDTSDFRLAETKHAGTTDDAVMQEAEKEIASLTENIEGDRKIYEKLISSPEEKATYDEFSKLWATYLKEHAQFLELSRANKNAEALAMLYGDMRVKFELASKKLTDLVELNKSGSDDSVKSAQENASRSVTASIIAICAMIGLGFMVVIVMSRQISVPVKRMSDYMGILTSGDLGQTVPDTDRKDEIGEMAHAVEIFRENLLNVKKFERQQEEERKAKEIRQQKIDAATERFSASMINIVKIVAAASTELQASAQSLAASAEETSKQSNVVASASTQAAANVQTVSAATEELGASIQEISQQVARSSTMANNAVDQARIANERVQSLQEAAEKISEITVIITGLAEQTNLLSLNATIEAARAGEAGKGFAVVASEVKTLANNSQTSTAQITSQISEIQEITKTAVDSIRLIGRTISDMESVSQSIAAAVQEQSSATQEISRNVSEVSSAASEVSENIVIVSQAAHQTGESSQQLLDAASELGRQADILKREFENYIDEIKTA